MVQVEKPTESVNILLQVLNSQCLISERSGRSPKKSLAGYFIVVFKRAKKMQNKQKQSGSDDHWSCAAVFVDLWCLNSVPGTGT